VIVGSRTKLQIEQTTQYTHENQFIAVIQHDSVRDSARGTL